MAKRASAPKAASNSQKTTAASAGTVTLRTSRLRLLPAVILIAVLTLSVRLGGLWQDYTQVFSGGLTIAPSKAQAEGETAGVGGRPAPSVTRVQVPLNGSKDPQIAEADPKKAGEQLAQATPASTSGQNLAATPQGGSTPLGSAAAAAAADPLRDPVNFTQSEIELLQKLAERREVIESRSQELSQREALLKAAEGRIDRKIGELQQLQNTITGLLKEHDQQEQEKVAQLVKIYATMKPKDAARIFDELDMPILITVLENMKEAKSAPILASMTAEKARQVTEEMSRRRAIPLPDGTNGG